MRIAVLHPHTWPEVRRGGERYAHDLMWWLARQGHQVDLVAGAATATVESVDGGRIVRVVHHHRRRLAEHGFTPLDTFGLAVLPWLARHRYDVVHAFVPAAAIAGRLTGQRVVYTALGHPAALADPGRRKDRRLFRWAVTGSALATALSASAAAAAESVTGVRPRVLSPGVRTDVFRADLRPRTGPPRLLFAADGDDPRKRLAIVLTAMRAVLDAHPDAKLLIGAGGRLPDLVDPRVRSATTVLGVGELSDVAGRYQSATVTVLPAVNEAFGLVLVESMAAGTPVVAVRSGSMPEIVTAGTGTIATPDDPAALAAALVDAIALAANPATPAACVERARRWSWDVVGPEHLSAYDEALRQRRR